MVVWTGLTVYVWFAWLLSNYKNSFFLFLLRFALLILDLSPEAATRGVLYKKLLYWSFYKFCNIHRKTPVLECLHKPRWFLIIDLLQFVKLLELLAINWSSSERRIIFAPRLLQFSHVLVITCMVAHFPAVELNKVIRFSILSRKSGFLWHSSKWARQFGRFRDWSVSM